MPSIDDLGVGPCNHLYKDGVCWFCGVDEVGDESESQSTTEKALQKLAEKLTQERQDSLIRTPKGKGGDALCSA